jgi:hypothetical protein
LQEELGLVAAHDIEEPLMVTCTTTVGLTAGHVDVSLWYVVKTDRKQSIRFDKGEFAQIRWFKVSEVPLQRSDPHMGRFLKKLGAVAVC